MYLYLRICSCGAVFVQMIWDIINNSGYAWLPPLLHFSSLRRPRVNISNVIVINASVLNVFNVIVTNNILNVLKQSYSRSLEKPGFQHWPFRKKAIGYIYVMCCLYRHVIQLFKRSPFKCWTRCCYCLSDHLTNTRPHNQSHHHNNDTNGSRP